MILTYSGRSKLSAKAIARASNGRITAVRSNNGDINWGRATANTELNPNIENGTNKRVMRELFKANDVPIPSLFTPFEAYMAIRIGGIQFVGRPDSHMKGRGYWLCSNQSDIDRAQQGTRKKKAATHFMKYIPHEVAPHEYRVHIFKGRSIRISEKLHTAFHEYTTIKPTGNVKHVRKAAKQAVEALGLDFGAVDIIANDTQCWVLEVNSAPGLGGSMPALYADTFIRWENGEFDEDN